MESIWRDIRYSIGTLANSPGFTFVAVAILALGIGANTAIFSVVDAVLLRPLPIKSPGRVMAIHDQLPRLNLPRTPIGGAQYIDLSRQTNIFESAAAFATKNFNLTGLGTPERLQAERVTAGFFPLLGLEPVRGRGFTQQDDHFHAAPVAMLSLHEWKQLFNSDPAALGKSLILDGTTYEIIGVAPAAAGELYPNADIWVPMAFAPREVSEERRFSLVFGMLARLKDGLTVAQAQSVMSEVARKSREDPNSGFNIEVRPITDEMIGEGRQPLFLLLAAVAVVLLICCANIASLLLARASGRTREMAIRIALGAGRWRLIRQLLTESLILALTGGALGVVLAELGVKALIAMAPADLPRIDTASLDARVLYFTLLASLGSGVLFGLVPAFAASKANLAESLKESGRGETASRGRQRLRSGLVVAEVALAFSLLFSAGLLLRSFAHLLETKPGFNPHNILTMRLALPYSQYQGSAPVKAFYNDVVTRIAALPGVEHAAAAYQPPFTSGADNSTFTIKNWQPGPGEAPPHADYVYVTADYLKSMGISLLKGRDFTAANMPGPDDGPIHQGAVAIIDENLANRFWPNGDAIGGGIGWDEKGPFATIVGIVKPVRLADLTEQSKGTVYLPFVLWNSTLVVRTSTDPHGFIAAVRDQVHAVDSSQPVYEIRTMDERIALSLSSRRFAVTLLTVFAALALLLAPIGLYGVIAYLVGQRTQEIGIRMALGAARADILKLVIRHALLLSGTGLVVGVGASIVVSRYMQSLLFEVPRIDGATIAGASVLLAATAIVAALIPARRASRVDPMVALRYQ